ncbi:MAG: MFS transporter [Proteobacteria bacterium]|nr:MFS transporter [Pseudomonadota bacterium]
MFNFNKDQLGIQGVTRPLLKEQSDSADQEILALSRSEKSWIYFALTIFSFGVGANEFSAAGLLPQFADAFEISNTQAAYVQSVYALTVAAMGLPVTAFLVNQPRKRVLAGLSVVFLAGSVTSALAPNYPLLMLGRILSALPHAPFYGISSTIVSLMNPGQEGKAIAIIYLGMTLANIAGTPGATWLARQYSWRFSFWVLAGIGGSGLLAILVSAVGKIPRINLDILEEFKDFIKDLKKPGVSLGLLAIAFGFGGMVAFSGYIAPIMTDVVGFSDNDVPWIAATLGMGFTIGNYLGGKLADRNIKATLYGSLMSLAVTLGTMVIMEKYPIPSVIGVFALGAFGFGSAAPLSRNVIAKGKTDSILVSASTNVAFNAGIAFTVWATGLVIDADYGYPSAGWMGAAFTTVGLVMAIASNWFKPENELKQIAAQSSEVKKREPEAKAVKRTSLFTTVVSWFNCNRADSQRDQTTFSPSMK